MRRPSSLAGWAKADQEAVTIRWTTFPASLRPTKYSELLSERNTLNFFRKNEPYQDPGERGADIFLKVDLRIHPRETVPRAHAKTTLSVLAKSDVQKRRTAVE